MGVPAPLTRAAADELFAPTPQSADKPATPSRLWRLNEWGLLGDGVTITNAMAHQMLLDGLYAAPAASEHELVEGSGRIPPSQWRGHSRWGGYYKRRPGRLPLAA